MFLRRFGAVGTEVLQPLHRHGRTEQHSSRLPVLLSHHIHAVVHAVAEIHIQHTRFSEHDPVAGGYASEGVAGRIICSAVSLRFGNDRRRNAILKSPRQNTADQTLSHLNRMSPEKIPA
ncbi:hypothetical protein D3C81_1935710 [compost metagenome]